jgi:hypothetical protein
MTPRTPKRTPRTARQLPDLAATDRRPEIIVDFHVERGLLFVVLKNIGASSAYRVVTKFDHPFRGLGGKKDITEMALFRGVEFVPPGKQFLQLIDQASAYFGRDEPRRLKATVTYADRDGRKFEDVMPHDLQVYRDLGDVAGC